MESLRKGVWNKKKYVLGLTWSRTKIQIRYYSRTHYEILGVKPDASAREIKNAYFEKCKKVHPDSNSRDTKSAHEEFVKLQESYKVLNDSLSRAQYDSEIGTKFTQTSESGRTPKYSTYSTGMNYQEQEEYKRQQDEMFWQAYKHVNQHFYKKAYSEDYFERKRKFYSKYERISEQREGNSFNDDIYPSITGREMAMIVLLLALCYIFISRGYQQDQDQDQEIHEMMKRYKAIQQRVNEAKIEKG